MLKATFHSILSGGKIAASFEGQVPGIPPKGTYIRVPENIYCPDRSHTMPVDHVTIDPDTGTLEVCLSSGCCDFDQA